MAESPDKFASHGIAAGAERLSISSLTKQFPGTLALDRVDLRVASGEVHSICGGNGSGKSTLIKVLAGVYQGDSGEIRCGGHERSAAKMSPSVSREMGIRVVHQDLGVFPDMSVAENLSLGSGFETIAGSIRRRKVTDRAKRLIERFEIPARPDTLLSRLGRAAQTQVAVARALQDQADSFEGLLILDEPTASLPAHEVELVLRSVRRYSAAGQSIIFVSHRLDEVLEISDSVTVLRDGKSTGSRPASELNESQLIELILGRMVDAPRQRTRADAAKTPILEVEHLDAGPLQNITFDLNQGEVLGVAGLLGSGRTELLRSLFGDLKIERGGVRFAGKAVELQRPADAIREGIAFVPEDRAVLASFPDLPVYANLAQSVIGSYFRGWRVRDAPMRSDGEKLVHDFGIKAASVHSPMRTLSGGNQQKVILARWLRRKPRLLLLDEPTVGVDVGARGDLYQFVWQAVEAGAAAIVVASDFEELVHVSDRVLVLKDGAVVGEANAEEMQVQRLMEMSYTGEGVTK